MNKLIIISWVFLLILTSCVSERSLVFIPAGKTVEVDYPDYGLFKVSLKNKGSDDLNIAVLSKESNSQVRGFGLAMRGSADVLVESSNKLVIQNKTEKSIYVKLKVTEESPVINNDDEIYIYLDRYMNDRPWREKISKNAIDYFELNVSYERQLDSFKQGDRSRSLLLG